MADQSAELIRQRIEESVTVTRSLLDVEHIEFTCNFADLLTTALGAGNKVLFCGNGGSAADATHLAAEFVGRYQLERSALPALSLTDNASSMSAIGNDYDYRETFSRQVRGLGRPGDVLVALSTSGGSVNVLDAVEAARQSGLATVGLTGSLGGALDELSDLCLRVASTETARIQEAHMLVGHTVCELVEHALFAQS